MSSGGGHYVGRSCECQFEFPGLTDIAKLRVTLKRPGSDTEEPLTVRDGAGHAVIIAFVPESPGDHQLSMNIAGRQVNGSPFNIPVEEDPGSTSTGSPLSLALELVGVNLPADFEHLTAKLKRPGEETLEDGLDLELQPDNTVALMFIPYVSGEYLVHIYKMGKEVPGSPFSVQAKGPTPADPSKVRVIGDGELNCFFYALYMNMHNVYMHMLYVVSCKLYVVCCMMYNVCCMLYVVCCMLYVVCCMLYVVCCMLYAV